MATKFVKEDSIDTVDSQGNVVTRNYNATQATYKKTRFNPATSDSQHSYTAWRVMEPLYNQYKQDNKKPKVFGYWTDWSQFDGRYEYPNEDPAHDKMGAGRGRDLGNLHPTAYDKLVLGFLGIVGDDLGVKAGRVAEAAQLLGKKNDEVVFLDPWGDIAAWRNNGFKDGGMDDWSTNPPKLQAFWHIGRDVSYTEVLKQKALEEGRSYGVLTGLYNLQQRAKKEFNHNLELAFSIGGWSLSAIFTDIAKDAARRHTFVNSVVQVFKDFPMFTEVDIDWEYPGVKGDQYNKFDPASDGDNYILLIQDMRKALDSNFGAGIKKISIASPAKVSSLVTGKIDQLFEQGLDHINVMTYDFFGTPWAEQLDHQTNLFTKGSRADGGPESCEKAIQWLIDKGVPREKINLGWGAYGRAAKGAKITNKSPLVGQYNNKYSDKVFGSFEDGAVEWQDVLYNYFDHEKRQGINGFKLYTDAEANADYLYSETHGMFISIDTARSVFAKSQYALREKLGGTFVWTADQDNGVLVNAAREGLGYVAEKSVVDMQPLYLCGENINDAAVCHKLTHLYDGNDDTDIDQKKTIEISIEPLSALMKEGDRKTLKAVLKNAEDTKVKYEWHLPSSLKPVGDTDDANITIEALKIDKAQVTVDVGVTIFYGEGQSKTATKAKITIQQTEENRIDETPPVVTISPSNTIELDENTDATVTAIVEGGGSHFTYLWSLPDGLKAKDGKTSHASLHFTAEEVDEHTTYKDLTVTVTNKNTGKSTQKTVTVLVKNIEHKVDPKRLECTDPKANDCKAWSARVYDGENSYCVSYNGLKWVNAYYASESDVPGKSAAWKLVSDIVLSWESNKDYSQGDYVNYNGYQYKCREWNNGKDPETHSQFTNSWENKWIKVGHAKCEKIHS